MQDKSSSMNLPAHHVAPATPPGSHDAHGQSTTSTAHFQPSVNAWIPDMGLTLQENSATISSQVPCCSTDHQYATTTSWEHSLAPRSTASDRPVILYPGQLPQSLVKDGSWSQKTCEPFEFYPFDPDAPIGQAYTTDETVPIIDLRFSQPRHNLEPTYSDPNVNRLSDSSMAYSVAGTFSDAPVTCGGDDLSTTLSEAPALSEYGTMSNRTSLMSNAHLSPVVSPGLAPQIRPDPARSQSRGLASPSPRPSMRSAPYSTEGFRGTARWSTGSHSLAHGRRSSPFAYSSAQDTASAHQRYSMQATVPSTMAPTVPHNMVSGSSNAMLMQPTSVPSMPLESYRSNPHVVPSNAGPTLSSSHGIRQQHQQQQQSNHHLPQPPTLASHGLLKLLQNNLESQNFHGHYANLSGPPDLYPSLNEEPAPPPPEDMKPADADLVPYEQELRFEGDMYTPKWVRGHGNKREGWCGLCKPGRWLVLKNSAYWYDKSFTHGISAATGAPFQEPLDKRRMDGNPDVWEGLCASCNKWIALVSSKKKGTTWFRHAYKCHSHAKLKDIPKRRRDQPPSRMPGPPLSLSMGLRGEQHQHQQHRPATPPPPPPPVPSTSYASISGVTRSMPQFMHTQNHSQQQQHQHHQYQHAPHLALGPLTPPRSVRSSVGRNVFSSPTPMYGNMI